MARSDGRGSHHLSRRQFFFFKRRRRRWNPLVPTESLKPAVTHFIAPRFPKAVSFGFCLINRIMYVLKIYFETFLFRKYFSMNECNEQIRGTLSTTPSAPVLLPGVWSQGIGWASLDGSDPRLGGPLETGLQAGWHD